MSVPKYTIGSQFYRVTASGILLNTVTTIITPIIKGLPVPRSIKIVHGGLCEDRYITQDENDDFHLYDCISLEQYLTAERWYTVDYDKAIEIYENQNKA
jgi:hypothetical protein